MRLIIPALGPIYAAFAEPAYALTRFVAGAFLVPHGLWKLFGVTGSQGDMIAFFHAIGLEPAVPLMIAVGIVEAVGGVFVAIGFLTRPAALAAALTTGTAALYVHLSLGFYVEPGGIEFSGLWAIVLLMFAVKGAGSISVDGLISREV